MVNDVIKRVERLDLAKEIIREELRLAGNTEFPAVEIAKAARVYLVSQRHNTSRLQAKLRRLRCAGS